jgi:hypothetical protein
MDEGNPSSIETLVLEVSHESNLCMAELEMPLKAASVAFDTTAAVARALATIWSRRHDDAAAA